MVGGGDGGCLFGAFSGARTGADGGGDGGFLGQVRVLASTGAKRSPAAPEVPTIAESAIPGYVVDAWQGVFAPAKTPPAIVQKISGDLAKALADPALVEKLARNAYTVDNSSGDELAKFLKAEIEKWEVIIKTTGLKID